MESYEEFLERMERRRLERKAELRKYQDKEWQKFLKFIDGHLKAINCSQATVETA